MNINVSIKMKSTKNLQKVTSVVVNPLFFTPSTKIYDKKLYDDNSDEVLTLDLKLCDDIIPIIGLAMDKALYEDTKPLEHNHYEIYISIDPKFKYIIKVLQNIFHNSLIGNSSYIDSGILISPITESPKECGFMYVIGAETCYFPKFSFFDYSDIVISNIATASRRKMPVINDFDKSSIYPVRMREFDLTHNKEMNSNLSNLIDIISSSNIMISNAVARMTKEEREEFFKALNQTIEPVELSAEHLRQLDAIDNAAQALFDTMSPNCEIGHNAEMLGTVIECAKDVLLNHGYSVYYPGIVHEDEADEYIQEWYYPDKEN